MHIAGKERVNDTDIAAIYNVIWLSLAEHTRDDGSR
jgi:hypothetical protein